MTQIIIPQSAKPARKASLRGLKHFYPCDQDATEAIDLTDRMGGVPLTEVGTLSSHRGRVNNCIGSTSPSNYAKIASADATDFKVRSGDWSCTVWFILSNTAWGGICGIWDLFSGEAQWALYYRATGRLAGLISYDGATAEDAFECSPTLSTNTWYMASLVKTGDNIRIGLDADNFVDQALSGELHASSADFTVLQYTGGDGSIKNIYASLEGLSIWDKALSDAEVAALYNGGDGVSINRQYPLYVSSSPNISTHQAVVVNDAETLMWAIDTTAIRRLDMTDSYNVLTTNSTPFSGLTGDGATLDHLSTGGLDGDGTLWVSATDYNPGTGGSDANYLLGFDATTLARTHAYNLDDSRDGVAPIVMIGGCLVPKTTSGFWFYSKSYRNPTYIEVYDTADGSWVRNIALSGDPMDYIQGLAYHESGWIYAGNTDGFLYRFNDSGRTELVCKVSRPETGGEFEGIYFVGDSLYWLHVAASKIANKYTLQEPL